MKKKQKPTIAFLTSQWSNVDDNIRAGKPPGGVPSIARVWTQSLADGFDVHVFILCETPPDWPKETVELGGVRFHWISKQFRGLSRWLLKKHLLGLVKPLWLVGQLQMAWRVLRAGIRPDIFYCMRPTFLVIARLLSWHYGAKLVLRNYGTWLYHLWFEQKRWLPRINALGTLLAHWIPMDLFIMTNDGTRGREVAQWAHFPMEKFRSWINGVDKTMRMEGFDKKAFKKEIGVPADSPMLMTLGRLDYWKRLDRPIDAMPGILRESPGARLVIVGGGPLEAELRRRAEQKGVADSVIFIGPVTHDMIKYYLNATDIFIMPNDLTNMCSTLIEGLICGCCVVTRDVGSTTEVVTDGRNAVVLQPGEAKDIAEAALRLLKDPQERQRLSEEAHRGAMKRFQTWDERMKMEVQVLKELICSGHTA